MNKKTSLLVISTFLGGFSAIIILLIWLITISQGVFVESLFTLVPKRPLQGISILAAGIDEDTHVQRTDSIVVIHLNREKNRIGVLSVPRDTFVILPKIGPTKINHAYAHGGMPLLKDTVASLLNIPIEHHVKIDLNGVEKIINGLGGVRINVEKDLKYHDNAAGLHIDLKKGDQTLKGEEAIGYIRFRQDKEGDIGRIKRQQTFLKAMASKVLESNQIILAIKLLSSLGDAVETNLSLTQMMGFVDQFSEAYKEGNIKMDSVPGAIILQDGISYWRADIKELDRLINETLFGFGEKNKPKPKPKPKSKPSTPPTPKPPTFPLSQKIEILNGNGTPGSAATFKNQLKKLGATIVRVENSARSDYLETKIAAWKNNTDKALKIAKILGINPKNIVSYNKPSKSMDITIVLGKDWQQITNQLAQ